MTSQKLNNNNRCHRGMNVFRCFMAVVVSSAFRNSLIVEKAQVLNVLAIACVILDGLDLHHNGTLASISEYTRLLLNDHCRQNSSRSIFL